MKIKRILPLLALLSLGASLSSTVETGFFDKLKKWGEKQPENFKKQPMAPLVKWHYKLVALPLLLKWVPKQAHYSKVLLKVHLADQAEAAADASEKAAQEASDAGDKKTESQHKAAAKIHRETAAKHRQDHEKHKKAYEAAGGNFDDDYEKHVGSKIRKHVQDSNDNPDDADSDSDSSDGSDSDSDSDNSNDNSDDSDEDGDSGDDSDEDGN